LSAPCKWTASREHNP